MKKTQPDPIPDRELHISAVMIIEELVVLLRLLQTASNFSQEFISLLQLCLYRW
jgi:hypothetical protein